MHPEIKANEPGKCPKCGMALVAEQVGGKQTAHLVNVVLGPGDGQRTQVVSGLAAGQTIVVAGLEGLTEGQAIQSVPWGRDGPLELPSPSTAAPAGHAGGGM
jgi:hypothetical protein